MKLLEKYRAWRTRRYWEKRHLEFLRTMIQSDWRWLSHHPVSAALTDRYRLAASKSWYEIGHESPEDFRKRLGIGPEHHEKHFADEVPPSAAKQEGEQ